MTKFKVGDKVRIIKKVYSIANEIGSIGTVTKDVDGMCLVNVGASLPEHSSVGDSWHYTYAYGEIEKLDAVVKADDDPNSVVKRTNILVTKGELSVQHTTNSKRSRVGFLKQGRVMGHVRFEEIDAYIELLTKLKEEAGEK